MELFFLLTPPPCCTFLDRQSSRLHLSWIKPNDLIPAVIIHITPILSTTGITPRSIYKVSFTHSGRVRPFPILSCWSGVVSCLGRNTRPSVLRPSFHPFCFQLKFGDSRTFGSTFKCRFCSVLHPFERPRARLQWRCSRLKSSDRAHSDQMVFIHFILAPISVFFTFSLLSSTKSQVSCIYLIFTLSWFLHVKSDVLWSCHIYVLPRLRLVIMH